MKYDSDLFILCQETKEETNNMVEMQQKIRVRIPIGTRRKA
jgi:hypothetical protein